MSKKKYGKGSMKAEIEREFERARKMFNPDPRRSVQSAKPQWNMKKVKP